MSEPKQNIQRPLSPHLQVYKLPLTAKLSITHRITGAGLAVGTILVTAFLLSAAISEEAYDFAMSIATSPLGVAVLFFWSLALYFHMCNGIRHMIWDMGKNFSKVSAHKSNYFVILAALICTAVTWAIAYGQF